MEKYYILSFTSIFIHIKLTHDLYDIEENNCLSNKYLSNKKQLKNLQFFTRENLYIS
jgi:hypothetical protein